MKFIQVLHNAGPEALRESKREARSYSAQVAHARARKLRGPGKAKGIAEENDPRKEKKQTMKVLSAKGQPLNQPLLPYNQTTLSIADLHIRQPILSPYINFLSTLTADECFMFDHYIKIVMPYLSARCPIARSIRQYQEYLRKNWIIISSHDTEFIRGFLLAASRHLSMVESNIEFEEIAIRYKLEHLAKLRKDVAMQPMSISPRSVSSALVLSFDEVSLPIHICVRYSVLQQNIYGQVQMLLGNIPMALRHINGAASIVQAAGGPQSLGLSQFISYTLFTCVQEDRIGDWAWVLKYDKDFMKPKKG
ncbi:uncharacterized protein FMAN_06326 [Fusarium mangiferae]|uniref:Uncharacterized protein n=1 Tax=Fusarium mangiferae TaxID=192010 RepID=A0A1L7SJ53_FUSMA|nr:uncharacterized protein FMAN_06326 [Fusarium mangiferae]CVK86395.1 uncharacterized protein FMAN_06326 [Fusarium mangiferae]